MIARTHSPGLDSGAVLPVLTAQGPIMPLAATSGGTWLSLEGLPLLPTPLKVLISLWDSWGPAPRSAISDTKYPLGPRNLRTVPQALRGGYTDRPESGAGGDLGNQEDRHPWCVPGREHAWAALMQSLHNFLTEGGGTPGALIRPRSPQFGDSAAAEIWQIRTISQPPEWREPTA